MKARTNLIVNIFIYASLIGVISYFYKYDFFTALPVKNYCYLSFSFLFLFLGFVFQALSWHILILKYYPSIKLSISVASVGVTIFTKYIPGKLWVIIGRAGYVASFYKGEMVKLNVLSTLSQVLAVVSGLMLGLQGVINYLDQSFESYTLGYFLPIAVVIICIFVGFYLFVRYHGANREQTLFLNFIGFFKLLSYSLASWLLWGVGFAYFIAAFSDSLSLSNISIFASAGIIGILAIFTPGGLGVREAIMATLLVAEVGSMEMALTCAALARLWFFVGEIFIFVLGCLCKLYNKKVN